MGELDGVSLCWGWRGGGDGDVIAAGGNWKRGWSWMVVWGLRWRVG